MSPYSSSIITLIIGGPESPSREPSPVKFYIHEPLLVVNSPVFRAMLSKPKEEASGISPMWVEARSKEIRLPEDRVCDWTMLAKWLYCAGSECNALSADHVEKLGSTALLEKLKKEQPTFRDDEANLGAADYITWCLDRARHSYATKVHLRETYSRNIFSPYYAKLQDKVEKRIAAGDPIIDVERDLDCVIVGEGASSDEDAVTKPDIPRPAPPALGSLIRLYILADKYAINHTTPQPGWSDSASPALPLFT